MTDPAAEELRGQIARLEGRIDVEVDDPALRRALWAACDDAMAWSWQSPGMAAEKLAPVHAHFDGHG